MKRHYLYLTTCIVNGKKYIGQHITHHKTVDKMLNDKYLGSGVVLHHAIKKYGKKAFDKDIIAVYNNQSDVDKAEIKYIEDNHVLENKDVWYNRAPGGQYGRSERHSEYTSKRMKEIFADDEYRKRYGWPTVAEMETRKINIKRYELIRKLKSIARLKRIEEDKANKLQISIDNGFKSWIEYKRSLVEYKYTDNRKMANEWQRTPIGRFTIRQSKINKVHKGYGRYKPHEFKKLMEDKSISIRDGAVLLGCSVDTIKNMRRGWCWQRKHNTKRKAIKSVKNEYYEVLARMA